MKVASIDPRSTPPVVEHTAYKIELNRERKKTGSAMTVLKFFNPTNSAAVKPFQLWNDKIVFHTNGITLNPITKINAGIRYMIPVILIEDFFFFIVTKPPNFDSLIIKKGNLKKHWL